MKNWLRSLLQGRARKQTKAQDARAIRPRLETLEERLVPAVTYHGGPVLSNVEVQALYLGADWSASAYSGVVSQLEGFLGGVVNSSYLDMLYNAGYGVGRGSYDAGRIDAAQLPPSPFGRFVSDAAIENCLQADIRDGTLRSPDGNRFYIVFVEDNAVVTAGGANSQRNFLGYHSYFAGTDASGRPAHIRYAVVPYPGGYAGNAALPYLDTVNGMTDVASHELAEGVTDPDFNAWYDNFSGEENGDLAAGSTVYLNGYAVQRIADRNGQAMTPAGAAAATQQTYVLFNNGALYAHLSSGWFYLTSNVAKISDQSIDDEGHSMLDVVFGNGVAYEYHLGGSWQYLGSNVKDAKSGQGVSYLLFNNGALAEYSDASRRMTTLAWSGVTAIDAGTDQYGVNLVAVVTTNTWAEEYSDTSGWHYLGYTAQSVSAGQQGFSEVLFGDGTAYTYQLATGNWVWLGAGVASVTGGVDQYGQGVIDLVFANGYGFEWRASGGNWTYLGYGLGALGKAHNGVEAVLFSGGYAFEHTGSGWSYLTNNAVQVA